MLLTLLTAPLAAEMKVLALAGSTRAESYNKKLVNEAANLAREMGAKVTVVDLKDYPMPFFDEDLEAKEGPPASAVKLRQLMIESDAIIIASPTYNSSITAVLKNTLDWISRRVGYTLKGDPFKQKKFVIISASPGPSGGAQGLVHLRAILQAVGGNVLPGQVTIPSAHNAFDAKGKLQDAAQREELRKQMKELVKP